MYGTSVTGQAAVTMPTSSSLPRMANGAPPRAPSGQLGVQEGESPNQANGATRPAMDTIARAGGGARIRLPCNGAAEPSVGTVARRNAISEAPPRPNTAQHRTTRREPDPNATSLGRIIRGKRPAHGYNSKAKLIARVGVRHDDLEGDTRLVSLDAQGQEPVWDGRWQ